MWNMELLTEMNRSCRSMNETDIELGCRSIKWRKKSRIKCTREAILEVEADSLLIEKLHCASFGGAGYGRVVPGPPLTRSPPFPFHPVPSVFLFHSSSPETDSSPLLDPCVSSSLQIPVARSPPLSPCPPVHSLSHPPCTLLSFVGPVSWREREMEREKERERARPAPSCRRLSRSIAFAICATPHNSVRARDALVFSPCVPTTPHTIWPRVHPCRIFLTWRSRNEKRRKKRKTSCPAERSRFLQEEICVLRVNCDGIWEHEDNIGSDEGPRGCKERERERERERGRKRIVARRASKRARASFASASRGYRSRGSVVSPRIRLPSSSRSCAIEPSRRSRSIESARQRVDPTLTS